MKFILAVTTCLLLTLINGCSSSDQYLYDDSETAAVEVSAYMTRSFEQSDTKTKQDTIAPGDSIIFITNIYPSKSIRLQRYYWNMDGKLFANEFSFKSTVTKPGIHTIEFILIDFYGDIVRDSLTLYVAEPPSLDTVNFIPKHNSQGINHANILNFSWAPQKEDTLWQVAYRFTLTRSHDQKVLMDTTLNTSHVSYKEGLAALEKYSWKVEAINELNQVSTESISADFYTEAYGTEGAISGKINFASIAPTTAINFTLLDSTNQIVRTFKETPYNTNGDFFIRGVPAGKFNLECSLDSFPDFTANVGSIHIKKSQTVTGFAISIVDEKPPTIRHINDSDSLDAADTLRFIVTDGGGPLKDSRIQVLLEDTPVTSTLLQGDTLLVAMPSLKNSWTTRLLTVSAQDMGGNKASKVFYIRPVITLQEVQDE